MIRFGLVGVGAWGRRYVATIDSRSDCCIAAVARASGQTVDDLPRAVRCEGWHALVRLAEENRIDGVIAATTPENQVEIAMACATAGVPLLVEKPLGLAASDVLRVKAHFDRSVHRAPLVVDYVHLWSAAFNALQQRIDEAGGPTSITAIETEGCNRGPLRSFSSLYDYGPHDVAMVLSFFGQEARFLLGEVVCTAPLDAAGTELYDVRFELDGVPTHTRIGNGGTAKVRRFAVTLAGARKLVYDDTRPHPMKLLDGDVPVPVREGGALDDVVTSFRRMIELWRAGRLPADDAGASLDLSARVNGILDAIAAAPRLGTSALSPLCGSVASLTGRGWGEST